MSELAFRLTTVEAWELVRYLATSGQQPFVELSERLEHQLNEIEELKKAIEFYRVLALQEDKRG